MMLLKHSQREKMAQEISLHRKLQHKHVVKFISSFQCEFDISKIKKTQLMRSGMPNENLIL